ncbi:MAG: type II secretion system F family protein [Gemmatimonadetes bacterium]|nr:type II secretion system F family protein [Gemmatimonadota bacterium]
MLWVKKKMSYPMMNVLAGIGIAPFPVLFFGDAVRYFTTVGIELVLAMAFGGALLRIVARRYRNRPKVARACLCRALAIAVEAGLPMDLGVQAADDASLTEHLARLPAAARANQTLADTLAGWSRLTPDMQQVLGVADQTGDYTNTLKRLADLYDDGF